MKKFFLSLILSSFFIFFSYSESYKINEVNFNSVGVSETSTINKTQEYAFLSKYSLNKNLEFETLEEFQKYLDNYKAQIISSRLFESVEVSYELNENLIDVSVNVKDSHHLVIMPYPKFSSNSGLSLKAKAKDTNFLGSMNQMNTEINLKEIKKTSDGLDFKFGFDFSYDQPFKAGPFDATWINDYGLSYCKETVALSNNPFEWNAQTGVRLDLPVNDVLKLELKFLQSSYSNRDYIKYNDDIYFNESFTVETPIKLIELPNYTSITYNPTVTFDFNWDIDGINQDNDALSSPNVKFRHSLSTGKLVWINNMRKGYGINLSNTYTYNFQRKDFVPSIEVEGNYFNFFETSETDFWNRFGINTHFDYFHYFDVDTNKYFYGERIGEYLRGILDENYFGNDKPFGTTSSCILFNIDLPHNMLTTDFPKDKLNFNMQFSPFFDMALVRDRKTGRYFSFEDGYYCSGCEVLLFPKQWSSITVRASLGFDMKSVFSEVNPLLGLRKNYELFIGIGLQY